MIDPALVKVTRERTRMLYTEASKNTSFPTVVLDIFSVMHQRLCDIEDALGYIEPEAAAAQKNKMDTQGR